MITPEMKERAASILRSYGVDDVAYDLGHEILARCLPLSPSRLSSNDEGGVTEEMVELAHDAYFANRGARWDLKMRGALEAALSTKPEDVKGEWSGPYKTDGEALDATRRAVAEIIGADPETWPDHKNAPLAISATLALTQPPTPASGEQMEVVEQIKGELLWAFKKWQHSHTAEELVQTILESPALSKALVTLTAANERAERAASHWKLAEEQVAEQMVALNAAEALNTTLSEALIEIECHAAARPAIRNIATAALRKSQGER